MKNTSTRRTFLGVASAAAATGAAAQRTGPTPLDALAIARRHSLVRTQPTPNFFEGLLLGNGDIGACVTVRPDAMGIHLGKNDAWDIRVSEEHAPHIKPFQEVLEIWKRASEEAIRQGKPEMIFLERNIDFFRQYTELMESSYRQPWPRPWPCGTIWLHWDSRMVRILRQELDISSGVLTLNFEYDDLRQEVRPFELTCFVSRENGHLSVSSDSIAPILSVAYEPNWDEQLKLPEPELQARGGRFSCYQDFPATAPTEAQPHPPKSANDRNFALNGVLTGEWIADPVDAVRRRVSFQSGKAQPLRLDLTLFTVLDVAATVAHARDEATRMASQSVSELHRVSTSEWARFWSASAVQLDDPELEALWYHNQYFLACCLKPGKVAPGLFANWSSGKIGTAWHGDYHMNYNAQQVWWGVFSSNHVEQHEPYVRLVENLMPMAEWNARVQFNLPGAYFPHSAYPVPSRVNPYPAPPWGYEICETPWTVQSLWWQYKYTLDETYLARVYPLLRAAAAFLIAYLKQGDDGKYHIIPTVSPENWGATVNFRLNKDCIIDLALTAFLLDAMIEGSTVLNRDSGERDRWKEVRRNLAPYPSGDGPFGQVWLDVSDAPQEHVYNAPVTLAPVFPGEQVGLGLRTEFLEVARRTARTVRLEGGNDLVWQPLARARLGILDLDWFKGQVRYCMTPLGVANDRCRQIGGRYHDETDFDYMMRMGVWTENLALPAVINECLLQSYDGVIRLFPNTANLGKARFRDLRAAGAFLVSAAWNGKIVQEVSLRSEKGSRARIANPWRAGGLEVHEVSSGTRINSKELNGVLEFPTQPGGRYTIVLSN
jgi:alpha-L-fucosidase 2